MNTTTRTESTALATADVVDRPVSAMPAPGSTALILDQRHMQNMMAVAEIMAKGIATVPRHLQKNVGDCLAVVMQATQWGMNPFAVAQKTHVVNGTLGYEAQLVNAVVNTMAPTKNRIDYEWFGDWNKVMGKFEERESKKKVDEDTGKALKYRVPAWGIKDEEGLGIKVWATMKGETEPRVLTLLLVQCRVRNSPLWADDPRQQIAYLAVKRWARLHCPDVMLGVYTPDELREQAPRDMGAVEIVKPEVPAKLLEDARKAANDGRDAFGVWWKACTREQRNLLKDELDDLKDRTEAADRQRTVENPAAPVTDQQASAPASTQTDADGVIQATYADVLDKMVKAAAKKDADALDIAADWIASVADAGQRGELKAKYDALMVEISK